DFTKLFQSETNKGPTLSDSQNTVSHRLREI
ncbi:unnamed protein product, partial [marine sediment metagenome]